MKITDSLKPHENQRVMDLVAAGGVNVTPWSVSSKGKVDERRYAIRTRLLAMLAKVYGS
jgi:hypothetical protein